MNSYRSPRLPALSVSGTQPSAPVRKSPGIPVGTCLIDSPRDDALHRRQNLWSFHERNRGAPVTAMHKRHPLPDISNHKPSDAIPFRFRPTHEARSRDVSREEKYLSPSEETFPRVIGVEVTRRGPVVRSTSTPEPSPAEEGDASEIRKAHKQAHVNSILVPDRPRIRTPDSGSLQATTEDGTIGYHGDGESAVSTVPHLTSWRPRSGKKTSCASFPLLVQGTEMLHDQAKIKNFNDPVKNKIPTEATSTSRQVNTRLNLNLPTPQIQKIVLNAPPEQNKNSGPVEVPSEPANDKAPSPRRVVVKMTFPVELTPRQYRVKENHENSARKCHSAEEEEEEEGEETTENVSMIPHANTTSMESKFTEEESSRQTSATSIEADWEALGPTTSVPDTHRTLAELLGTNDYAKGADTCREWKQWSHVALRNQALSKMDSQEDESEERDQVWMGKFDAAVVDGATYNDFARTSKPQFDLPPEAKAPRMLKPPNLRSRVPELPLQKQEGKCLPLVMKEGAAVRKFDNATPKRHAKLRIALSHNRS